MIPWRRIRNSLSRITVGAASAVNVAIAMRLDRHFFETS